MEKIQYNRLPSEDTLTVHEGECRPPAVRQRSRRRALLTASAAILLASNALSLFFGSRIQQWREGNERQCWDNANTWSPAVGHIDLSYHTVRFDGDLNATSSYRGDPSDALDEAWDKYEDVGVLWISSEEFNNIGHDAQTSVRETDEEGGAYAGELEVFHQLHCLNYLRKASHWYYDHYTTRSLEFSDSPSVQKMHFNHCVEMLRQQLMCKADTGLITQQWVVVNNFRTFRPNFNTEHRCRNLDSIREFAVSRKWPQSKLDALRPQAGQVALDGSL